MPLRLAALLAALAALGCHPAQMASPLPTPHAAPATASAPAVVRHEGPVIDIHAHVVFDEALAAGMSAERPPTPEGFAAHQTDPRLSHVGAVAIAVVPDPARTRAMNDALHRFAGEDPKRFCVPSVHPKEGAAALEEVARVVALGCKMLNWIR